jgi:hypothetical protein
MAPELIILRVARGKAWTSTTNSEMTRTGATIEFEPHSEHTAGSTAFGASREAMGMVDGKRRASTLEEKDVV